MNKKHRNNKKDGYYFHSTYWQNYKKSLPDPSSSLLEVAFGMVLGDASVYKTSREAHIKFEQGYKQEDFLHHLFHIFATYTFMEKAGVRYYKIDKDSCSLTTRSIKSFWFKTFSHEVFTKIYNLFYINGRKTISPGLILNYLTPRGLAYWIMCDGSLQKNKRSIILHTQAFSYEENVLCANELKTKFDLNCQVIKHKDKYWVLLITGHETEVKLSYLVEPYFLEIPSMCYKLPLQNK